MAFREFHYQWEWYLRSSPEALWSLVADTNRFNHDTGIPSVEEQRERARLENARHRLRLFRFGVPLEWIEEPFEWIRPYRFSETRRYLSGPVAELRVHCELNPTPRGGTHLVYQVRVQPRNLLGWLGAPFQVGFLSARAFDKTFRAYDQYAAQKKLPLLLPGRAHLAPGGHERLVRARERLRKQGFADELVNHLADLIEHASDFAVAQIRPYILADEWRAPRRRVLEMCLWATRFGLLEMRWWLLCPLCRGPKRKSESLGEIEAHIHCDTCNIDFDVNFDRSVELVFHPNPAIRTSEIREFCVAGPQVTPHVWTQQRLAPGETRTLNLALERGRYRLRALELKGGEYFYASSDGEPNVAVQVRAEGWRDDEQEISLAPTLTVENASGREQLLILERTAWSDQAATAAQVTALQVFRDLFAREALRPGERISVGNLAILFTDLRDSTRLYREQGDAPAFGRVLDHYQVLRDAIAREDGAVVKTIGDAVMAVFARPINALQAILSAQTQLALPPDGMQPLILKAGIHQGSCIAVTLNDRLDYFGSSVNIAARLSHLALGNDVVISQDVYNDPEVCTRLTNATDLAIEPFETGLRGYDESFDLWRVKDKRLTV